MVGCGTEEIEHSMSGPASDGDASFRQPNEVDQGGIDASIPRCIDHDGDGYGQYCERGVDCDDRRSSAHPGAVEQCGDGSDNDCDDSVDEGCGCNEGESVPCYPAEETTIGVGACRSGFQICREGRLGPCEGSRTPVSEICNRTDDDCDGRTDEGLTNACGYCGDLPPETCDFQDNDCDGLTDEGVQNRCGGCGAEPDEYCDALDNDCDGQTDEECLCLTSVTESCYTGPANTENQGICRGGRWLCSQGARADCIEQILPGQEVCNGIDDDCDGEYDEGLKNRCGECGPQPQERCDGPSGDYGNGLDDDCDGQIDEGCNCNGRLNQPCFSGLPKHLGQGICVGGMGSCVDGVVVDCDGEVLPDEEVWRWHRQRLRWSHR